MSRLFDLFRSMLSPIEAKRARDDYADELFRDFVADTKAEQLRRRVEGSRK